MAGNWRETSVAKYGFKSTKYSASIPGQITSRPYTSGPEAPVSSNSRHKTSLCRADSGDGRRLTRIPVSRVNCCNSSWRASLNVLFDHSSRKVRVTGSRADGFVQPSRSKESKRMQIGRTILPPSAKTRNSLRETLREDTSLYIFCVPLEQSLARTTGSGRVVGYAEAIQKTGFWEVYGDQDEFTHFSTYGSAYS